MSELEQLQEENRLLKAALTLYANPEHWGSVSDGYDTSHETWWHSAATETWPYLPALIALNPNEGFVEQEVPEEWGETYYKSGIMRKFDDRYWTVHFAGHPLIREYDPKRYKEKVAYLTEIIDMLRSGVQEEVNR